MKILVVEDDKIQNKILSDYLTTNKLEVLTAFNAEDALDLFKMHPVDIVLTDYRLPKMTGGDLLNSILKINPLTLVFIITAYSTVEGAVDLIKQGAFDYIQKPVNLEQLLEKIKNARRFFKTQTKETESDDVQNIIEHKGFYSGQSLKMHNVLKIVKRVSQSLVPVLITGESGTGKEMIADLIHFLGPRKNNKVIKVNCAAIPESLLESELFGHIKGAFTGASQDRKGRFEEADNGTLFLDEIGELPMLMQVKLLRFLQSMTFEAIGSNSTKKVDVRIISATNKNLFEEIENKNFREDLFYRLNVIPVHLPPLRERKEDIPQLIDFILKDLYPNKEYKFTPEAMIYLINYNWDGNIRQLKNILLRIVTLSNSELITEDDLPIDILSQTTEMTNDFQTLAEKEREWILEALIKTDFNQIEAAKLLGIHRNTIAKKIKEYNLYK